MSAAASDVRWSGSGGSAAPPRVALQSVPYWLPLTSTWLFAQVKHLPAARVESRVVCDGVENLDQFAWPAIEQRKQRGAKRSFWQAWREPSWTRFVVDAARRAGAALIHSQWGDHACRDVEAAREAGLAHVATFYGKDVNFLPRQKPKWLARYREMFAAVDRVLCEGPHMGRCLVALGCPEAKVTVHHLGVDVDAIAFRPRTWDGGALRFLIAGSFREKKGFPDALDAIGEFQRGHRDVEITIIGDASADPRSHPEKERILAALERHGLREKTRLLGYQPHRVFFEEAGRAHLFVSPSVTAADGDTEGGAPVSLIEMAASGLPIVSSTHCDIPSVVRHGETGLLAGERDVPGLVRHLRWFAENPSRWEAMVTAGRRHVEAEYHVARQGERLAGVYEAAIAARMARSGA